MVQKLSLIDILSFEWNKGNLNHIQKHKIDRSQCEDIFYDLPIFFYDKKHSLKENRFLAYGQTSGDKSIILVFIIRNNTIRVISARHQNKKERKIYNFSLKEA